MAAAPLPKYSSFSVPDTGSTGNSLIRFSRKSTCTRLCSLDRSGAVLITFFRHCARKRGQIPAFTTTNVQTKPSLVQQATAALTSNTSSFEHISIEGGNSGIWLFDAESVSKRCSFPESEAFLSALRYQWQTTRWPHLSPKEGTREHCRSPAALQALGSLGGSHVH